VIRRSIKKVARAFGYELSRPGFQAPLPWTIENQGETTLDIEGDRLPLLANRTYEPPKMSYVRSRFGDDHRLKYILYYLDLRDLRVLEVVRVSGITASFLKSSASQKTSPLKGAMSVFKNVSESKTFMVWTGRHTYFTT
jgi:hypothetical protein